MSIAREEVRGKPVPAPTTGGSFPIGATLVSGGANFCAFSRSAASIELLLFDEVDDARPSRAIPIWKDKELRTGRKRHVDIYGLAVREGETGLPHGITAAKNRHDPSSPISPFL